jgi:hypothetical protein
VSNKEGWDVRRKRVAQWGYYMRGGGGAIDEKIGGEVEMELERLCIDG